MGLSWDYGKWLSYFNIFIKYKCNYYLIFIVVYLSKEKTEMTDLCSATVTKELSVLSVCFAWVTGRTGPGCLIFKIMKKNKPGFKNSFDKECSIKQNIVTSDGQKLSIKRGKFINLVWLWHWTMNWQMQIQSHQPAEKTQADSWQSSFMLKEIASSVGRFPGLFLLYAYGNMW